MNQLNGAETARKLKSYFPDFHQTPTIEDLLTDNRNHSVDNANETIIFLSRICQYVKCKVERGEVEIGELSRRCSWFILRRPITRISTEEKTSTEPKLVSNL